MSNQKASSSDSKDKVAAMETPPVQRALMPDWLFNAAVEGDRQDIESANEHSTMVLTIEGSESAPSEPNNVASDVDNLQSATYMGNTVLHIFATYGHTELVSMICQKYESMWRAQNKMLETPFHCAAKAGQLETISALIEFAQHDWEAELKVVLRKRNKRGETALHEAAKRGYEDVVFKLMEVDLLVSFELNNDGKSPLNLAAARGTPDDTDMVSEMLNRLSRRNIDPTNSATTIPSLGTYQEVVIDMPSSDAEITKNTPIHFLASAGSVGMVRILLENNSSLAYLQDSEGLFPIHLASRAGNAEMVALFLKMLPDCIELLDNQGRNIFHIAAEENMSCVFTELLHKSKENSWENMKEKLKKNPLKNMKEKLFTRMINGINATDNDGNAPLHIATKKGNESIMGTLYKTKKLDHNLRNREGLTSFDISVMQAKKSAGNSMVMQNEIKEYIEKFGPRITSVWFDDFLPLIKSTDEGNDSKSLVDQLQIIGLGAVLIATATFAAAFTLPGGYGPNSSPLFGRKYLFKAFILADALAFIASFFCVLMIMFGVLNPIDPAAKDAFLSIPLTLFTIAAKSMVVAFGLGLYLVLGPINKALGIFILTIALFSGLGDYIPTIDLFSGFEDYTPKWVSSNKFRVFDAEDVEGSHHLFFLKMTYIRSFIVNILPFLIIFLFAFLPSAASS